MRRANQRRALRDHTVAEDQRPCPVCNRRIYIENGRWTAHTDPGSWVKGQGFRQCVQVGKRASPQGYLASLSETQRQRLLTYSGPEPVIGYHPNRP